MSALKKSVDEAMGKVISEAEKARARAEKEMAKVKKQIDGTLKKADDYVKKNPERAALISVGIGAALGAAAAMLMGNAVKSAKKKKK